MTFYEAAVAVLREAGRPLHYKKITAQAIERDLLSHVGKTPEDTMSARLGQEAEKPSDQAVIEQVRPGVFGLREGVDTDDAGETISLRAPAEDVPEPEPVTDDSELEDEGPVDAPSVVRVSDDDRKRRGRRSRRGGRRRDGDDDDSSDDDNDDSDESGQDDNESSSDDASGSSRRSRGRRRRGRSRNRDDESSSSKKDDKDEDESEQDDAPRGDAPALPSDLPDIAAAALSILDAARGRALSASKVASELARREVGALGELGTSGLRSALVQANSLRAGEGRPPIFEETKPNFWALATATGSSLARSYDALERWQASHRSALAATVADKIGELDEDGVGTLVTLLLDRMGYTEITSHKGRELTISARSPVALTRDRVAVRVFSGRQRVGRDEVAALRGALHQFNASAGVIFAFGKVLSNASEELDVPNVAPVTVLDTDAAVEHFLTAGVGVARFSVDVSCLDDALFRELRKG